MYKAVQAQQETLKANKLAHKSLDDAQASRDAMALGCAHRLLGQILAEQKKPADAEDALLKAQACFAQAGDNIVRAEIAHLLQGTTARHQGR